MTDEIHRTTPIEDSIERIAPYPANFFVYKIPGSKFYQASARLNGVRAKKSHKTKSRTIARQADKWLKNSLMREMWHLQMDSKWILNVMTPPPRPGEGAEL